MIAARKLSSALSAANAVASHIRDWLGPGPPAPEEGAPFTCLVVLALLIAAGQFWPSVARFASEVSAGSTQDQLREVPCKGAICK